MPSATPTTPATRLPVSVGLPVHRIDLGDEFVSGDAIAELAVAAEKVGYDAVSVTDHPFPADKWLARGGHHALDPFSSLAFAGAATSSVRSLRPSKSTPSAANSGLR